MLTRIGFKLFRIGRYLERAEFIARYSKTHYLHYLDAASPEHKQELLESLLEAPVLQQQYFDTNEQLEENKILHFISIDEANPDSIQAIVAQARELAKGARDSIAVDLWEYINSFNHALNKFTDTKLQREGFLTYTKKTIQFSLIIKGYIDTVMVRDDRWMLLALGVHLERSMQTAKLLLNKMKDSTTEEGYDERNHLIAMLQSIGSYETFKEVNQQPVSRPEAFRFMVFNPRFPKSLVYNFYAIQNIIGKISFYQPEEKDAMVQQLSSLINDYQQPNEQLSRDIIFLEDTINALQELGEQLERKYLLA